MTPFDGKYQNLQTAIFTFWIFANVRPVRTKVTDTHTQTHTHRETDKPIAIGEILQIFLKYLEKRAKNGT